MKTTVCCLLTSAAGLLILVLSICFRSLLSELALKFLLFAGCILFGYGIAYLIAEKKTPH